MPETGFLAQQRRSPTGFTLVVAGHIAALTALALAPPTIFQRPKGPIVVDSIPIDPDPPEVMPEPPRQPNEQRSRMTTPPDPFPIRTDDGPIISDPPGPFIPDLGPIGPIVIADAGGPPVVHRPIVRAAEMISRDLQPPYPASEIRAQRGGQVRVRITIGTDGRVTAVEQISATSNAFWEATRQQALRRWRFRPATEDGRPVVATRVMTVTFRIEDVV